MKCTYQSMSDLIETMERMLGVWTEDQNQCNMVLNILNIREKARSLFEDVRNEQVEGSNIES